MEFDEIITADTNYDVKYRWSVRKDLPQLVDIDKRSYYNPWSQKTFQKLLKNRNTIGTIIENREDIILGYTIYNLHKDNIFCSRLAVHPEWRNLGFGTILVNKLINKLSHKYRTAVNIPIDERVLESQLFLKHRNFIAKEILYKFYFDHDAYCMTYSIEDNKNE